jgi:hypothetical protein
MNFSIGWAMGFKGIGTDLFFFFGILGTLLSTHLVSIEILADFLLLRTVGMEPVISVTERVGSENACPCFWFGNTTIFRRH